MRVQPLSIEHEPYPELDGHLKIFQSAKDELYSEAIKGVDRVFNVVLSLMMNQNASIMQQIDQGSREIDPMIIFVQSINQRVKEVEQYLNSQQDNGLQDRSIVGIERQLQPLIISSQTTHYDQALLDIMNHELNNFENRGWQAEFPVIFCDQLLEDGCIYSLYSGISPSGKISIKFKFIWKPEERPDDTELSKILMIKMKSGCYLQ